MRACRRRRFITCGEALIDLVPDHRTVADTFSSSWQALSAGGPMNTAVALAVSGADSHFLGRISDDEFGRQLHGHIEHAGVGLDLATTSELATSIAVVSLDAAGKARYAFHWDRTANFDWRPWELPDLAADDWLHTGSLAIVMPPGADVLLEWAREIPAPTSIDINVRPAVITDPVDYWRRLEPWLHTIGRTGILKASDDDIDFLAPALNPLTDPPTCADRDAPGRPTTPESGSADPAATSGRWRQIAEQWLTQYSLGLVVITRGALGASALDADRGWTDVRGYRAEVVDTVGAGDTFMAGFLDGWVRRGRDLDASLERGVAASSIVCGRQGAQPPTGEEIDARLSSGTRPDR